METGQLCGDFFDVSVVIPVYHEIDLFAKCLEKNNPYFLRNGIELIIVLPGQPVPPLMMALVDQHPFINWKIITIKDTETGAFLPKALNAGIKAAAFKYLLIGKAGLEFCTDVIAVFRNKAVFYPDAWFVGHAEQPMKENVAETETFPGISSGTIFAEKRAFEQIRGYYEHIEDPVFSGEETGARLEFAGWKKMVVPEAKWTSCEPVTPAHHPETSDFPGGNLLSIRNQALIPDSSIRNGPCWGTHNNRTIYNYEVDPISDKARINLLAGFEAYDLLSKEDLQEKRKVVALVATHNEQDRIPGLLDNLTRVCDGIILLDNGSEDETYASANSPHVLLKVKASRKMDEWERKNILLRLAGCYPVEWLFFVHAHERLGPRFSDLRAIAQASLSPTIGFYKWPATTHTWRMFRKKGHLQLPARLHDPVPAIPYQWDKYVAPILLFDAGESDEQGWEALKAEAARIHDLPAKTYSKKNYHYVSPNGKLRHLL